MSKYKFNLFIIIEMIHKILVLIIWLLTMIPFNGHTQSGVKQRIASGKAVLSGRVTDGKTGESLPGATIYIPDLKSGVTSDTSGWYHLGNLPKSSLLIQVSYIGYGAITEQIDLRKVQTRDFRLDATPVEAQEVVITGSGVSTDNSRSSISIIPISKQAILYSPSTNLIDAISVVPGLSQITTGGDISKPVIRGLSYNHVVILNEGVRQEDQQWGDEHGVEIDQLSTDRIEVLKGPASLFYGSDAMGGIINILEPIHAPLNSVGGEITSGFATNNRMTNNSLMIEGNNNGFLWRMRGSYKNAAAYRSPPEFVYNSGFNEINYSAMVGLIKNWGYTHLHFSRYDAMIGIVEGERDSSTGRFIDINGQIITDTEAKKRTPDLPYQKLIHYKVSSVTNLITGSNQWRINVGFQTNKRREFEETSDAPNLFMDLNTATCDLKFSHQFDSQLELVGGISGMFQINTNKGSEYLIPDYDLWDIGSFFYLKKSWERFTLNAGMRFDSRWVNGKKLIENISADHPAIADTLFPGFKSNFSAVSGSTGMTARLSRIFNLKLNIGSGFRAPNIAELGSNGVHPGSNRYEIGNPTLHPENSLQIDGELSATVHWLSFSLNGYFNFINQYIYSRNLNGEMIFSNNRWYPVYRFVQGNAILTGFECSLDIHPVDQLHFENSIDYVRATNESIDMPLPFIPPVHTLHTLKWDFKTSKKSLFKMPYVTIEAEFHFRQERIDEFETATPGYFLFNVAAGTSLRVQKQLWTIFISGRNLTNTKYYDHLSRLKEVGIYNAGWNLTFGIHIPFGIYAKRE